MHIVLALAWFVAIAGALSSLGTLVRDGKAGGFIGWVFFMLIWAGVFLAVHGWWSPVTLVLGGAFMINIGLSVTADEN